MKKLLLFFLFATFLSFFFSCKDSKDLLTNPDNIIPTDSLVIPLSPIDSKLILYIHEEINSSNRYLILLCITEKTYSPAGSKIISSLIKDGNTINIEFKDLLISQGGAAIFSPASVIYNIDSLKEGSYLLNISVNNKTLKGLLTVTNESYEIKIQPNNLIQVYRDKSLRVPVTIIWGQAESIELAPYQIFLDSLKVLGAKPHNLKAGDYYYFEVDSQGGFNTYSALGMAHGNYFLYNYEGDILLVRSLIKRFSKRYLDSIYIQLSGGRGEMYYSTVLKNEP